MFRNRNVVAWLILVSMIGLHVFDEAMTGFVPFFNQFITDLREPFGYFPAPTFSFGPWLSGLTIGIILLYGLTPLVARGGKVIRVFTIVLGVLMALNGLGHLLGSIFLGKVLPGMWSSPFLLLAAVFVVRQGIRPSFAKASEGRQD
jgi:ABC-type antimicrobial peptide transport system permease subunit